MTSTELEVVDRHWSEVLTEREAKTLDKQVRTASTKVATSLSTLDDRWTALYDLLRRAAEGQIHAALGYESWAAWVVDAVNIQVSDRADRKLLVSIMTGKRMSQRAIAGVLGVDQKTVCNDQRELIEGEEIPHLSDTVDSLDGSQQPRAKSKSEAEIRLEPEDSEVDIQSPTVKQSVAKDFEDELYQLENDCEAFKEVVNDPRFPKSRKRINTKFLPRLDSAIADLQAIADALTT